MADKKYRIEGDTLIVNDGVTDIEKEDFHTYDEDGKYKDVKDEAARIKKAIIPESVTSIGKLAFYKCKNLKSVTIQNGVKSIGLGAFGNCKSLTSITIPDSVSSIGEDAFRDCYNLTNITIPDSVTNIGHWAFESCESLKNITIPDSVTSIGKGAFYDCESLTNITIPNSVTSIGYQAFRCCYNLKSITIPDSVTDIGSWAFSDCKKLTITCNKGSYAEKYAKENNIPFKLIDEKYHIEGDTVIFNDRVTTIDETDFHYLDEDGMPCIFDDVKNIQHIIIPESVTNIDDFAFWDCKSLTNITIPSGVTYIGLFAFAGCESLTSVTIPDGVTNIGDGTFSDCESLTNITIPNSIEKIDVNAFAGCKSLTSITIPSSVTSISDYAFDNCLNLKSITIPNSVEEIGYETFYRCKNFTIICDKGSYAEKYAKENNIPIEYIGEHTKEQALSQIKDYINTLAEAMKRYDGKEDVNTYLEGYVGSSGADLSAFLSETSAAYIRNCFVSAYSGADFNDTEDKSPIERYETRISSAVDKATSLAEELVDKSEKTSVEEIVDDVMQNEDFKNILKKELKAEIPENHKDDIISGEINEQDGNEIIGTDMNTYYPVKEECVVYIRDIKDAIIENGAGTLTLDDFGDKHYNVQIESDSEIYTFKVSLPVNKTVGGVKVQGFKELGYIDVGKDEVGKALKEIAENTVIVSSKEYGSKPLNELLEKNSKAIER